jgi:hypothetical protein
MIRSLLAWTLTIALLAACSGSGDSVPDDTSAPDAAVDATDAVADTAPDALGKDESSPDTPDAAPDVPPVTSWRVAADGTEPATEAWVRVTLGAVDEHEGFCTLRLEVGAFESLLGLSFHLGFDPALAELTDLTRVYEPPTTGSTGWALLARAEPGAVLGGLAAMRRGDTMFGGSSGLLSGSLEADTVLYEVRLKLLAPGTLALSLDFPDTVAVAPDWTTPPLERLGLTLTVTKEVAHE